MNDILYFDNAATSFPKPPQVIDEMARCMREYCGNPGRGSHTLALRASETLYECRATAAEMFGADLAENVAFTLNTTYALNIAIKSVIPSGSHVLISDIEHNAVLRPVEEMARRGVLIYDIFNTSGSDSEVIGDIRRKLKPETAAIICTLASNICSRRLPSAKIGRLCREKGILFIADGAQAAGHRRINVQNENIDVLCLPAHKGLYGPQGIGMMVYSKNISGNTVIEGGSGVDSLSLTMPEFLPERHEAGTQNTPAAAGLLEGMRYVRKLGEENIAKTEHELWYRLYSKINGDKRFTVHGDRYPSSVMLINKKGMAPAELGQYLNTNGICVRSGLHCAPLAHQTIGAGETGGVRISFGTFNTAKDVDRLCDVLGKA